MADGNTSFDDCDALTSSFGWTGRPSRSLARLAMTSLAFMFELVPDPVWNTSIGNWSSCSPAATSAAAASMAAATSPSITPREALAAAAAPLMRPKAEISDRSSTTPETGKFSTARCVCAPHRAVAGTRTSPIVSRSMRKSALLPAASSVTPATVPRRVASDSGKSTDPR
jgi:hypothetical protein